MAFILERSLGSVEVVEVGEGLVVNAQFEDVSMLDNIEHVVADLEGVLEGGPKFLDLENLLSILKHLLLPAQMRAH